MEIIEKNINDILDIKGKNLNFLNNLPYSQEYIKLASKWSQLPMYKDKLSVKNFFDLLHNCQVILLISGTGSGKTVLVPKFFLKYLITMKLNGKIAITNPKILTTTSNAEYGAKTLDVKLGEEVGYKFKGAPQNSVGPKTKLLYVTDGIILATILSGDNILSTYQGVIIDEAHERHVQIDLLLKLIKEIIYLRPEFKLIIMSATINTTIFRNYFNIPNIKFGEMEVSGESNFQIQQNWLNSTIKINRSNYIDFAVERCLNIIDNTEKGDIIIFVPTQNDAIKGCNNLKSNCPSKLKIKNSNICNKLYCVEVFSKMKQTSKDMAISKDLYKSKGFERKIIFATNVAESSITFDGLVYVIDSGYELANYYDVIYNSYIISKLYISQAQVKQRIGRSGRTQPGISYHLYTNDTYNKFKLYPEPNISVIDLTDFVLSFIKYTRTIKNMIQIIKELITIPKIEQITFAIYKLCFCKCLKLIESINFIIDSNINDSNIIDNIPIKLKSTTLLNISSIEWQNINNYDELNEKFNGTLTSIGLNILNFKSTSIISAYAIIMSKYMNCQIEIIQLIAIIELSDGNLDSLFVIDRKEINKAIKYFSKVIVNDSDHLTILNIYKNHYLDNNDYKYLNRRLFDSINNRIDQLFLYANKISAKTYENMKTKYNIINHQPFEDIISNILYVLAYSHYYNLLKKESNNKYKSINFINNSIASLEYIKLIPESKKHTKFAICHSLSNIFGRKNFKCITQIPDFIINDIKLIENINYFIL